MRQSSTPDSGSSQSSDLCERVTVPDTHQQYSAGALHCIEYKPDAMDEKSDDVSSHAYRILGGTAFAALALSVIVQIVMK